MFKGTKNFLNRISLTKVISQAAKSLAADKKRTAKRNRTGKIDSSQNKVVQQIDKVALFFSEDRKGRAKEKEAKSMAKDFEKNLGLRETSKISKAIDAFSSFMIESRKEQAAKISDFKKRNSFMKSEREKYIERENKKSQKFFDSLDLEVKTDDAEEDLTMVDWAREISSRNFKVATPDSLNDSMSNSEKIRLADEILMNFHFEEAEKENPFRRSSEDRLKPDPAEDAWYEQEAERIESMYSEEQEWARQQKREEDLLEKSISKLNSLDFDEYDFD